MANRSVSVLMTLKGGTRGSIFQADLLNNARTVWPRTTKFGRITQVGRSVFLGGHPCPYRKGAMSQRSPTFGVPFHIWNAYTLLLSTSKFDVATHVGRGLFLGCQSRLIPRVRGPSAPQFFFCWYIHPLSQNYQIWRGNTCGRGAFILGSATTPSQESGVPGLLYFWVFQYLCPTPFNAERPNSAWCHIWGGACFRRSVTPLHLHKCVARFCQRQLTFLFFKVYTHTCHYCSLF